MDSTNIFTEHNTQDVTIEEMCYIIFTKPVAPVKSNVLMLHESCEIPQHELPEHVFKLLKNILFLGISIKFPQYCESNDVKQYIHLSKVNMQDFQLLRKYFNSFGYDICINTLKLNSEQIELSKIDMNLAIKYIFQNPINIIKQRNENKITNRSNESKENEENDENESGSDENEESGSEESESEESEENEENRGIINGKCKCGWELNKIKHFSNYYTHFIRNDNIGVSLHFTLL